MATDEIPDGEFLPSSSRLWPDERTGPWLLTFHWQVIAGRAEPVGLDVTSSRPANIIGEGLPAFAPLPAVGQPLTTSILRQLRLSELVTEERERVVERLARRVGGRELGNARGKPPMMRLATERRLRRAAEIYSEAWRAGQSPVKAVGRRLNVTDAAATKLVARARAAGFLPPASPGVPMG